MVGNTNRSRWTGGLVTGLDHTAPAPIASAQHPDRNKPRSRQPSAAMSPNMLAKDGGHTCKRAVNHATKYGCEQDHAVVPWARSSYTLFSGGLAHRNSLVAQHQEMVSWARNSCTSFSSGPQRRHAVHATSRRLAKDRSDARKRAVNERSNARRRATPSSGTLGAQLLKLVLSQEHQIGGHAGAVPVETAKAQTGSAAVQALVVAAVAQAELRCGDAMPHVCYKEHHLHIDIFVLVSCAVTRWGDDECFLAVPVDFSSEAARGLNNRPVNNTA